MAVENYRYKPGGLLLTATCVLLAVCGALDVLGVPLALWDLSLLARIEAVPVDQEFSQELSAEIFREESVLGTYGLLFIVTYLTTAVCFLCLSYRAGANAHRLARDVEHTAGSAAWWYFIPIGNLWKPYSAIAEYFRASRPADEPDTRTADWDENPVPGVTRVWWGLWLVTGFLGQISFRLTMAADGRQDYLFERISDWIDVADGFIGAGAAAAAILTLRRLFEFQRRKRAERPAGGPAPAMTEDGRFLLESSCRECGEPVEGDTKACPMCGARRPARRKNPAG